MVSNWGNSEDYSHPNWTGLSKRETGYKFETRPRLSKKAAVMYLLFVAILFTLIGFLKIKGII